MEVYQPLSWSRAEWREHESVECGWERTGEDRREASGGGNAGDMLPANVPQPGSWPSLADPAEAGLPLEAFGSPHPARREDA